MKQTSKTRTRLRTVDLAYAALFAVLLMVCAWINIPLTVPFTLQTFGVFAALVLSIICSPVDCVNVDGITVVGERINPTGKKRFQQAQHHGRGRHRRTVAQPGGHAPIQQGRGQKTQDIPAGGAQQNARASLKA